MAKKKIKAFNIPVLSFFTGGGFLDIGFEQAGFRTVWTNEVNTVFADMYRFGMTWWRRSLNPHADEAKISNTRSVEKVFAPGVLQRAFHGCCPKFFGIIGGPPCPDFSVGGKNRGGKGTNGRLSKTYVHRICSILPSFFVFENVPGLYKTKIHREFLLNLEKLLEKRGYCLDLSVLNALEFGVPQDRERLFMIGIKKEIVNNCLGRIVDENERNWFQWPKTSYEGAKARFAWPEIVEKSKRPLVPRNIPERLTVYSLLNHKNDPEKSLNGKDYFKAYSSKFRTIKEGDTRKKSFKRLHRYRFSPTVCYGHNEVHLHPWKKRRLSVREAMRIQGIPDEYALPEDIPLTAKFTIVSNGVPVPLAFAVASSLRKFFEKGNCF